MKKWEIRSPGAKNAFLQADGFGRNVLPRTPIEWDPPTNHRTSESKARARGLIDAPSAPRWSFKNYSLNADESMAEADSRCQAPPRDPCLFFGLRKVGGVAGAISTHNDDILGRGGPDVSAKIRILLAYRSGATKLQESPFVLYSMELSQGGDSPANLTLAEFAQNLQPSPT